MSLRALAKTTPSIRKIENFFILYRWLNLILVLVFCLLKTNTQISLPFAYPILFFVFAYNLLITMYSSYIFDKVRRHPVILSIDIFICAFLIFITGGWRSSYYLYSFSPILVGAYIHKTRGAFLSACTLSILYYHSLYFNGYSVNRILQLGILDDYIANFASFFFVAFFFALPCILADDLRKNVKAQDLLKEKLLYFYQVAGAISSSLQLKKFLNVVVSNTYELTKPRMTVLALFNEEQKLKINPNSIVVRDNGKVYRNPNLKDKIEKFAQFTVGKDEPIFINRESLTHKNPSDFLEDIKFLEDIDFLICVPLKRKGKHLGVLASIDPLRQNNSDDIVLLSILGSLASIAIENAKLVEKTQNLMIMEERNRIARDMHDGLAQSLFSLVLNLEVCTRLIDTKPEVVKQKLIDLQELASKNLAETRQYIYNLCPNELKELGLCGTLDNYTKEFSSINGVRADFRVIGEKRNLSEETEKVLYYITQEALSNARRHARAKYVNVQLRYDDNKAVLVIEDDGQGFDVSEMLMNSSESGGRGLSNIRKRASTLGGECTILSEPDVGTKIEVAVPLC